MFFFLILLFAGLDPLHVSQARASYSPLPSTPPGEVNNEDSIRYSSMGVVNLAGFIQIIL